MKKFIGLVVLLTISLSTFAQKGDFSLLGNFGYQSQRGSAPQSNGTSIS